METRSILIVGVGGQGTLLASKLLGKILLNKGYDVKVSELHGMSQRGGSVTTYVRYGERVYSPVIESGEADYIVSFEMLEAARWSHCLKPGGTVISSTGRIDPLPVTTGAAQYPEGIPETLRARGIRLIEVDAPELAARAGSGKTVNTVLMGVLARELGLPREDWEAAIAATVPVKYKEVNLRAFALGVGE